MEPQRALYLVPYLLSVVVSTAIAALAWGRRGRVPAAAPMVVFVGAQAFWTAGFVCELLAPSAEGKVFWDDMQLLGTAGWMLGFVAVTLRCTGRPLPRWSGWAALATPAVTYMALAFTDRWHGWVRPTRELRPGDPFDALVYPFTPVTWAAALYMIAVLTWSLTLLGAAILDAERLKRRQLSIVAAGFLAPFVGMVLTMLDWTPTFHRDMTPFTFALGNALLAWGVLRHGLLDLAPLAREAALDTLGVPVFAVDQRRRVAYANPTAEALGCRVGERLSEALAELPELVRAVAEGETAPVRAGASGREARDYLVRKAPLGGGSGEAVVLTDVTELEEARRELQTYHGSLEELVAERTRALAQEAEQRRLVEAQLVESQKLEAVGTLASGVAHDFNNALQSILGCVDLLLDTEVAARDASVRESLELIQVAGKRASELTQRLLVIGRRAEPSLRPTDVGQTLRHVGQLLSRTISKQITLELEVEEVPAAQADAGQLEQVLLNLALNARDAIDGAGTILLRCERARPGPLEGAAALLIVRDDGCGMEPAVRERIFEPFFTTKESGGTGLGLATSYAIVQAHEGKIECESERGVGTTFRIWIPLASTAAAACDDARPQLTALRGRSVLVVDDDASIRRVTGALLRRLGMEVRCVASGEEGIEAYRAARADVVLLDLDMPGMGGAACLTALREQDPDALVVLASGYVSPDDTAVLRAGGASAVLSKPYAITDLVAVIGELCEVVSAEAS